VLASLVLSPMDALHLPDSHPGIITVAPDVAPSAGVLVVPSLVVDGGVELAATFAPLFLYLRKGEIAAVAFNVSLPFSASAPAGTRLSFR
jgi:hypothetical protein